MGVQEFKCPGCGAKLKWDAAEQKMKCDYCDNTYDIATLEEFEQEENSAPVEEYAWDPYNAPGEVTGLKTYICQSCGGAITVSDDSAATSCPYCDSPVVLNNNVTGMLQPDLIIPFTKTKEEAQNALRKFCKGKPLLPPTFVSEHRIEEIRVCTVRSGSMTATLREKCASTQQRSRNGPPTNSITLGLNITWLSAKARRDLPMFR